MTLAGPLDHLNTGSVPAYVGVSQITEMTCCTLMSKDK